MRYGTSVRILSLILEHYLISIQAQGAPTDIELQQLSKEGNSKRNHPHTFVPALSREGQAYAEHTKEIEKAFGPAFDWASNAVCSFIFLHWHF